MDSYVIRIYRRNSGSPQDLVGLAELVDVDEEKAFASFEELRAILSKKQVHSLHEDSANLEKGVERNA